MKKFTVLAVLAVLASGSVMASGNHHNNKKYDPVLGALAQFNYKGDAKATQTILGSVTESNLYNQATINDFKMKKGKMGLALQVNLKGDTTATQTVLGSVAESNIGNAATINSALIGCDC